MHERGRLPYAEAYAGFRLDEVEARLKGEFPDVEMLIHPDPEGHVDERGIAAKDVLHEPPPE